MTLKQVVKLNVNLCMFITFCFLKQSSKDIQEFFVHILIFFFWKKIYNLVETVVLS